MKSRRYLPTLALAIAALLGCDAAAPRSAQVDGPTKRATSAAVEPPFDDNVAAARLRAEAEQKPLLMFFAADWCSFCRQMGDDVFTKPEFRALAERFVCVRVEAAKHPELCTQYRVADYPTLVLAAPDGTPLERVAGLTDAMTVAVKLNAAMTAYVAVRPDAAIVR